MDRRRFVGTASAFAIVGTMTRPATAQLTTPALRLRKSVQSMAPTDPFFAKYASAVEKMHALNTSAPTDRRSWRNQALIHLNYCVHGGNDFFHWHRHYITQFELICCSLLGDPNFALPYWDWTANNGKIPEPFYDLNFLNVSHWNDTSNASSPNWGPVNTNGSRGMGKGAGLQDSSAAFTKNYIDTVLGFPAYNDFWQAIEGTPHGAGHVIVGAPQGHMASGMSPLDPIFWLHHCNVDRLWEKWRAAGNTTPAINRTYANHFVDASGQNIIVTAAQALNASALGFRYEEEGAELVVASGANNGVPVINAPLKQKLLNSKQVGQNRARLGLATISKSGRVGVENAIPVTAVGLTSALFSQRTFRILSNKNQPQLAGEGGRILLRLSGVTIDKDSERVLVNVFINCPYLTPETKQSDKHFAGMFALFGGSHDHSSHSHTGQVNKTAGGATVVIDATSALRSLLRDGQLVDEQLKVQLMPIVAAVPQKFPEIADSTAIVTVAKVEVLRT